MGYSIEDCMDDETAMSVEISRLRAALERLADDKNWDECHCFLDRTIPPWVFAQEALNEKS